MFRKMNRLMASAVLTGVVSVCGCESMHQQHGGNWDSLDSGRIENAPSDMAKMKMDSPRQVAIDNFSFSPAELTVPVGEKVVWVNHDDVPHTVVSNSKLFASKAMDTDDKYEHVFAAAGTYPYFCSVHPHMTGTIVVK